MKQFSELTIDQIILVSTLIVGFITFIVKEFFDSRRELRIANREIYQRLEVESIKLFRFDAGTSPVTGILWAENHALPQEGTSERYAFLNYVCQILNLFEMSIRFRKERIMPPEVFGSWVIWYYDVFVRINFKPIWKEIKLNYTCDLRRIVDKCLELLSVGYDPDIQKEMFFRFVAREVNDKKYVTGMFLCGHDNPSFSKCINCPSRMVEQVSSKKIKNLQVSWWNNPETTIELSRFFADNVNPSYISHGEIYDGRATGFNTWRTDLPAFMAKEFKKVFSREKNANKEHRVAVATSFGKIVGIAMIIVHYQQQNPYIELTDLLVKHSERNKGVGSVILKWVEKELVRTDLPWIFLESSAKNTKGQHFFSRHGYEICSKIMVKKVN